MESLCDAHSALGPASLHYRYRYLLARRKLNCLPPITHAVCAIATHTVRTSLQAVRTVRIDTYNGTYVSSVDADRR